MAEMKHTKRAYQREEHADFYDSRADLAEDYEARRAARLIESAREAIMQKDAT